MEPSDVPAALPRRVSVPSRQHTGCLGVLRSASRSAWKKIHRIQRAEQSTILVEPLVSTIAVDNGASQSCGDVLEIDSRDPSVFDFEAAPILIRNVDQRERLAALCARYSLPQEPAPHGSASTTVAPRVSRSSRMLVRKSEAIEKPLRLPDNADSIAVDSDVENAVNPDASLRHESQPPSEKTKYTCHKCASSFPSATNAICENCGHEKCNRCARQIWYITELGQTSMETHYPPFRQKRVHRPAKQRVRHYCESCDTFFPPGTNTCPTCRHRRCTNCKRRPAKRRRTEDKAAVTEVEATHRAEDRIPDLDISDRLAFGTE